MIMTIAHTGRTGKDTSITFDTDKKIYCNSREEHDTYIYAEQTRDVTSVIRDLKHIGYTEVSSEEFRKVNPKRIPDILEQYGIAEAIATEVSLHSAPYSAKTYIFTYPLWIGNSLKMVLKKNTDTAEISIINDNGKTEDGYFATCKRDGDGKIATETARALVNCCYYNKPFTLKTA